MKVDVGSGVDGGSRGGLLIMKVTRVTLVEQVDNIDNK